MTTTNHGYQTSASVQLPGTLPVQLSPHTANDFSAETEPDPETRWWPTELGRGYSDALNDNGLAASEQGFAADDEVTK